MSASAHANDALCSVGGDVKFVVTDFKDRGPKKNYYQLAMSLASPCCNAVQRVSNATYDAHGARRLRCVRCYADSPVELAADEDASASMFFAAWEHRNLAVGKFNRAVVTAFVTPLLESLHPNVLAFEVHREELINAVLTQCEQILTTMGWSRVGEHLPDHWLQLNEHLL